MPSPITINANFIDLLGNPASGYMQALIVSPSGVYDLTVAGTGIIVPKSTISGTGSSVSISVWGNDVVIDTADGLKDTYYTVNIFDTSNVLKWSANYSFTGAGPINLVGFPILNTIPAPTGGTPTNLLTSNNIWSGSNTFTGTVTFTGPVVGLAANSAFWNTTSKTAAYTALAGDMVLANTSGGGFTVTLPLSANNKNFGIRVKKISSDTNIVTIAPSGADLIDSQASLSISAQFTDLEVIADGVSNWEIA